MGTTLVGCILLASVASGPKIVNTGDMRLDARGVGFKVYDCVRPIVKARGASNKLVIDSSRPLRRFKKVGR